MTKLWPILLCVVLWMLAASVALLYPPAWSTQIEGFKSIVVLINAIALAVLTVLRKMQSITVILCLGGGLLLGLHLYQLAMRVADLIAVDPDFGIIQATWLKVSMLGSSPLRLWRDGFTARALVEWFWNLIVPVLQVLIVWHTARALRFSKSN